MDADGGNNLVARAVEQQGAIGLIVAMLQRRGPDARIDVFGPIVIDIRVAAGSERVEVVEHQRAGGNVGVVVVDRHAGHIDREVRIGGQSRDGCMISNSISKCSFSS